MDRHPTARPEFVNIGKVSLLKATLRARRSFHPRCLGQPVSVAASPSFFQNLYMGGRCRFHFESAGREFLTESGRGFKDVLDRAVFEPLIILPQVFATLALQFPFAEPPQFATLGSAIYLLPLISSRVLL